MPQPSSGKFFRKSSRRPAFLKNTPQDPPPQSRGRHAPDRRHGRAEVRRKRPAPRGDRAGGAPAGRRAVDRRQRHRGAAGAEVARLASVAQASSAYGLRPPRILHRGRRATGRRPLAGPSCRSSACSAGAARSTSAWRRAGGSGRRSEPLAGRNGRTVDASRRCLQHRPAIASAVAEELKVLTLFADEGRLTTDARMRVMSMRDLAPLCGLRWHARRRRRQHLCRSRHDKRRTSRLSGPATPAAQRRRWAASVRVALISP